VNGRTRVEAGGVGAVIAFSSPELRSTAQHATAEQIRRAAAAREMNHSMRVDRGLDARRIECLVGLSGVAAACGYQ
jgi:hypothetical protein